MGKTRTESLDLIMPLVAAGTGETVYAYWPHEGTWLIDTTNSGIVGDAVSAHATNTTQLTVVNDTDTVTLMDHDTTTGQEGALTAGTKVTSGLSALSGTQLELTQGDKLSLVKADSGTGQAWGGRATIVATRLQG